MPVAGMVARTEGESVQKLLCCLMGFEERSAQMLRGLAQLFRPGLTAEWEFTDGWRDNCALLICDLDDPTTHTLWQQGSLSDLPLAVATSAPELPPGRVLRKPIRGQGPHGLVQVLNQAASEIHPRPGTAPRPVGAAQEPLGAGTAAQPDTPGARIVPFPAAGSGAPMNGPGAARAVGMAWSGTAALAGGPVAAEGSASALARAMPAQEAPTTSVEEAAPPVPAGEPEPLLLDAGARLDLPYGLGGRAPAICPADVIVESAPSAAEPL
ncbi:MAG TPA: hypothetical protein VD970_20195, partial [Acetobacteraceae bacterium]|nr:hypothetical protein [Acetobacteraceae bacterium]